MTGGFSLLADPLHLSSSEINSGRSQLPLLAHLSLTKQGVNGSGALCWNVEKRKKKQTTQHIWKRGERERKWSGMPKNPEFRLWLCPCSHPSRAYLPGFSVRSCAYPFIRHLLSTSQVPCARCLGYKDGHSGGGPCPYQLTIWEWDGRWPEEAGNVKGVGFEDWSSRVSSLIWPRIGKYGLDGVASPP